MNKTLHNITYVLSATLFAKLVGFVSSFILPKLLSPENYGAWALLLIIPTYTPIAVLGTVETLVLQYPYYKGQAETHKARAVENSVFASIILGAGFILLCNGLTFITDLNPLNVSIHQVRVMLLVGSTSLFSAFFYHRFAAHQNFRNYSMVDTFRAVATIILLTSFCWLWGLTGGVVALLIAELSICLFSGMISFRSCGPVEADFDTRKIWEAVRIGFPITIVWWSLSFSSSLDRLVSGSMLGKAATGHYALALNIVFSIILLPQAINRVFYPKINEGLGKNVAPKALAEFVLIPIKVMSLIIPVLIAAVMLVLPVAYDLIFRDYLPGIDSARILLIGLFFSSIIGNGVNYLVAKGKQTVLFYYVVVASAVNAIGAIALVKTGLGIEGIAFSTSFAGAVLCALIWLAVMREMNYTPTEQIGGLVSFFSPLFIFGGPLVAIMAAVRTDHAAFVPPHPVLAMTLAVSLLIYFLVILTLPPYKGWVREIVGFLNGGNKVASF